MVMHLLSHNIIILFFLFYTIHKKTDSEPSSESVF